MNNVCTKNSHEKVQNTITESIELNTLDLRIPSRTSLDKFSSNDILKTIEQVKPIEPKNIEINHISQPRIVPPRTKQSSRRFTVNRPRGLAFKQIGNKIE